MKKVKNSKPKISIRQSKNIDKDNFGDEPTVINSEEISEYQLLKFLNWYSYMLSRQDSFDFLIKYYSKRNPSLLLKIQSIDPERFDISMGWVCRMIDRGIPLADRFTNKIDNHVNAIINRYYVDKKKSSSVTSNSIDKRNSKEENIIADIEEIVDSRKENAVYQYLVNNSVSKVYVPSIVQYYKPVVEELDHALNSKDESLKEGYRHLKKAELKNLLAFFQSVLDDLDRYSFNTKVARKPRKKKVISLEKKLANVQYMERFDELQLVSKKPESIVKAKEAWIFDARYKKLHRYVALEGGLDIKGTTIINFDPNLSVMKLTGRKTPEIVSKVLQEGKIGLRKIMDTINSNPQIPTGRINSNVLILKSVS